MLPFLYSAETGADALLSLLSELCFRSQVIELALSIIFPMFLLSGILWPRKGFKKSKKVNFPLGGGGWLSKKVDIFHDRFSMTENDLK